MTDEFIVQGIEADRYLKALRLTDRFETEIFDLLRRMCMEAFVGPNEEMFGTDLRSDANSFTEDYSATVATIRDQYEMKLRNSDLGRPLELNLGIEWVEPEAQGVEPATGNPLFYAYYKIRSCDEHIYDMIRKGTAGPPERIRTGKELWWSPPRAPGIFYIPLTDGEGLEEAFSELGQHFTNSLGTLREQHGRV